MGAWTWLEARGQGIAAAPAPPATHRATIDRYCVSCHNDKAKTGGLSLETADLTNVGTAPDVWEKVVRKVRVGMMPPQGAPTPDAATRRALVTSLTTALDAHGRAHPDPGRALVHRLNRTEYGNAVHDLLALDIDPAALLPADDSAYGFDNVADVLGVSPLLLERYISAAGKVTALAVGDPEIGEVRNDRRRVVEGEAPARAAVGAGSTVQLHAIRGPNVGHQLRRRMSATTDRDSTGTTSPDS